MVRPLFLAPIALLAGCSTSMTSEPSLAHRSAEEIDPRIPIPDDLPPGVANAAFGELLAAQVNAAKEGVPEFQNRATAAAELAANGGEEASESWIAAQQALSRLVEQQGVTARAAANVDELASKKLQADKWISPADQAAIKQAQDEIAAIATDQHEVIDRIAGQLAR